MILKTKLFGEVEIDEKKIIEFPTGMIGFENQKKYILMHADKEDKPAVIRWLQSVDKGDLAFPVIDPLIVNEKYNPIVEEELLGMLGEFELDDLLVLSVVTVTKEVEKMTVNLKAPVIINSRTLKAIQIIVDNEEYNVRQLVYNLLKTHKEKVGE